MRFHRDAHIGAFRVIPTWGHDVFELLSFAVILLEHAYFSSSTEKEIVTPIYADNISFRSIRNAVSIVFRMAANGMTSAKISRLVSILKARLHNFI